MKKQKHPSSQAAKLDATTDAAYAIIDQRDLDREAKTLRLRALRLEREAAEQTATAGETPKPRRKAKAADLVSRASEFEW